MSPKTLSESELKLALGIRDLADPARGPHAMQLLLDEVVAALRGAWGCEVRVERASPIVTVADNYDRLGYPPDGAARDARYTRYVDEGRLLRSQTSAMVPPALDRLARAEWSDVLLVCPGLVYRRDVIDRLHTGEPHQLDLWRVRRGARLTTDDLRAMIGIVVAAALPGVVWRTTPASHPYTTDGLQVDAQVRGEWIEVGECGLANPRLLAASGHEVAATSGLAMGVGLDRLLMLRKGIDDIRLLRSSDARVADQMQDLAPYRAVSRQPPIRRDLSVAVAAEQSGEELGDRVRAALGERAASVEEIAVLSETPAEELPAAAAARLGIVPGQKNVLVRITLRDLDRTLTDAEANALRDAIYAALHEGHAWQWACAH